MNSREVNDDLLKEWLLFREENMCSITTTQNKKHYIHFDEIFGKILNSMPKQNREFVQNN